MKSSERKTMYVFLYLWTRNQKIKLNFVLLYCVLENNFFKTLRGWIFTLHFTKGHKIRVNFVPRWFRGIRQLDVFLLKNWPCLAQNISIGIEKLVETNWLYKKGQVFHYSTIKVNYSSAEGDIWSWRKDFIPVLPKDYEKGQEPLKLIKIGIKYGIMHDFLWFWRFLWVFKQKICSRAFS